MFPGMKIIFLRKICFLVSQNHRKNQCHGIHVSESQCQEWLFVPGEFLGLLRNSPCFFRLIIWTSLYTMYMYLLCHVTDCIFDKIEIEPQSQVQLQNSEMFLKLQEFQTGSRKLIQQHNSVAVIVHFVELRKLGKVKRNIQKCSSDFVATCKTTLYIIIQAFSLEVYEALLFTTVFLKTTVYSE